MHSAVLDNLLIGYSELGKEALMLGAVMQEDTVHVFSKSADKWMHGKVDQDVQDNSVCVEYAV